MDGGPGRTRTSNQAVMSAPPSPEKSMNTVISVHDWRRMFAFGRGVSLVIYWSAAALHDTTMLAC